MFLKIQFKLLLFLSVFGLYTCDAKLSKADEGTQYSGRKACEGLMQFSGVWENGGELTCLCQAVGLWTENCQTYSPRFFLISSVESKGKSAQVAINSFYNQSHIMKRVSLELLKSDMLKVIDGANEKIYRRVNSSSSARPGKHNGKVEEEVITDLPDELRYFWQSGKVQQGKNDFSSMDLDFCGKQVVVRNSRNINGYIAALPDVPHGVTFLSKSPDGTFRIRIRPLLEDGSPYDNGLNFEMTFDPQKGSIYEYDELAGQNIFELSPSNCGN